MSTYGFSVYDTGYYWQGVFYPTPSQNLYGLQLFNWIWQLYPNLSAFFTDEGILPRRALMVSYADRFSLLTCSGRGGRS